MALAAYRFPYLLAGDSVVLKQDSNYYEHFYHDLRPMEHYIPFKRDLSNVEEQVKWAKSHDAKVCEVFVAYENKMLSVPLFKTFIYFQH